MVAARGLVADGIKQPGSDISGDCVGPETSTRFDTKANGRPRSHRIRDGAKHVWNDTGTLREMMDMGERFLRNTVHLDDDAALCISRDVVSGIWEECKYNLLKIEDEQAFHDEVMGRLRRVRRPRKGKFVSLDAPIPGVEGDIDRHSSGWNGYRMPSQEDFVFLSEIEIRVKELPDKQREVVEMLLQGATLAEIGKALRISVHSAYSRAEIARRWLSDIGGRS